jgi:uncharacterized protein (TIGR02996 family)
MTEREALLRAVCENPDDDTPRLVFADWLDENGEPERAEFIRLQCGFQSMFSGYDISTKERPVKYHRMHELQTQHSARWTRELPTFGRPKDVVWQRFFYRGFVTRLDVSHLAILQLHGKQLLTSSPVSHLGIVSATTHDQSPALARLRTASEYTGVRFITLGLSEAGEQLDHELSEFESEQLYTRLSVLFLVPFTAISQSIKQRITQINSVAEKHGRRVECGYRR